MKTKLLIFILWVPVVCLGATVNPINISNIKLQSQIDKSCQKYSNVGRNMQCFNHLMAENAAYFRGTEEYAEKHYKALSSDALYTQLLELIKLKKTARYRDEAELDPIKGELTKEDYQLEISWIKQELSRRHYVPRAERRKPGDSPIRVVRP